MPSPWPLAETAVQVMARVVVSGSGLAHALGSASTHSHQNSLACCIGAWA
jgi:hypothetical protein